MRRLWLHIGSHKTGSTTVQKTLRVAMREKTLSGWRYLSARPRVDFNPLIHCEGFGAHMHPVIRWNFLDRRLDAAREKGGDIIISTEMLFWLNSTKQIQALADRLRQEFDEINILAYLRRQDALALSHRKQVVMGRAAYQFYGAQIQALPEFRPHMMRYFDYAAKLAKWEAVFGPNHVTVRRFQPEDLVGGDTVSDFFATTGIAPVPPANRMNPAWSRSQILAGLWLRQRGYPREAFLPDLLELAEDGPLSPARAAAAEFLARFDAVNEALAARYDPDGPARFFTPDMARYPEVANDDLGVVAAELDGLAQRAERRMTAQGLAPVPIHTADRAQLA